MKQDGLTLYKLIILFMLEEADYPLTNAQVSDFILEKDYTNYFNIQKAISALEDNAFITTETIRNSSHLHITPEGSAVLGYCKDEISDAIKHDILVYLNKHESEFREEVSVVADYYEEKKDVYISRCIVKDGGNNVIELNLSVASEEEANTIFNKWKDKSQEIYAYLIQQLLAD